MRHDIYLILSKAAANCVCPSISDQKREGFMRSNKPILSMGVALPAFTSVGLAGHLIAHENGEPRALEGRIIAIGIPGVSAISIVGSFLPGGPIHDKPALTALLGA
jgi:hypothetical protein